VTTVQAVTLGIAAYGALLATFTFWRQWSRDRPALKLRLNTQIPVLDGRLGECWIGLNFANVGHRAVVISSPGLELPNRRRLVSFEQAGDRFPCRLEPGDSAVTHISYADVADALRREGFAGSTRLRPTCYDAAGRLYRGRGWKATAEGLTHS